MSAPNAASLQKDPRWLALVERFAFDQPGFAVEVCGMVEDEASGKKGITWQQAEIGREISAPGCRVSIASGHGTGKTRTAATTALWHLCCYFGSNTIFTAPKVDQLYKQVWQEIADMRASMEAGPYAWLAKYIVVMDKSVYIRGAKKSWWITARTAPKGSPENLAGAHRDWLLIWADEGSGIPDANFEVLVGAMSDERNRFVISSQPTRPSGYFYDTHHKKSKASGGIWTAIRLNSEESPIVSQQSIINWRSEYDYSVDKNGLCTSAMYQVKVLGQFPNKMDGYLLGRSEIEACFGRQVIREGDAYGYVLSVDVGAGEYRDFSVATLAMVCGYGDTGPDARRVQVIRVPIRSNSTQIPELSAEIYRCVVDAEEPDISTLVDAGGMGISVCQSLDVMNMPYLRRVKWGQPCWRRENQERFFNLRAQAMWCAARAAKDGRLGINADVPNKTQIADQASRVPYKHDERFRYVIERKAEMAKIGLPSPDDWDSICFLFLEDADYIIADSAVSLGKTSAAQSVVQAVDDYFSRIGSDEAE